MPRYTVCVDWTDSAYPAATDTDEVIVVADTPALAVNKAIGKWRGANQEKYPTCRIDGAFVLTRSIRDNPDSRPVSGRDYFVTKQKGGGTLHG